MNWLSVAALHLFCNALNFCFSQIFLMNSSNQEKRRRMHLRPGNLKRPQTTPLTFRTIKTNMGKQREFHSWRARESAFPRRTRQSHVKTSNRTPLSLDATIIITRFPHNTPQVSANMTQGVKTVLWSLSIPKPQEGAPVNLPHTRPQKIWTCLCLYHPTAVWRKLQVPRRRATLFWKKHPRLQICQDLTSNTCLQQVCLHCFTSHVTISADFKRIFPHYSDIPTEREPPQTQAKTKDSGVTLSRCREDAWGNWISGSEQAPDVLCIHPPLLWRVQQHCSEEL